MENPLSDQLKNARKAKGLTQQQLSELTNVHKDTICAIETGRAQSASVTTLQLLGKALEIKFEITYE